MSTLIHKKKLYQQDKIGKCVFVGYGHDGVAKYCSMCGTTPSKPFNQYREHYDKSYPFHLTGYSSNNRVYVSKSPIDVMSRATLSLLRGQEWKSDHYLSLGLSGSCT
ncbi:hypothetical protein EJP82_25100 [Paenibacillus anaericanus]|uniref:Uncharacterized protein n=2 Tax=Paenibacillus anaericanus TaxID=170367 RepID=A0A433XZ37_9BACL|nr:hypothetical protein EJP82_25100 [Paenibacillus anaericanus]